MHQPEQPLSKLPLRDVHVALPKNYIYLWKAGCVCKTGAFCCGGGCEAGDESLVLF